MLRYLLTGRQGDVRSVATMDRTDGPPHRPPGPGQIPRRAGSSAPPSPIWPVPWASPRPPSTTTTAPRTPCCTTWSIPSWTPSTPASSDHTTPARDTAAAAGRLPGRPARPPRGRPADRHRRRGPQPPQHRSAPARPEPAAAVPAGRPRHQRIGQAASRGGPGGDLASPDRRPPARPHRPRPPAHAGRRRRRRPPTQPTLPRRETRGRRPIDPHAEHAAQMMPNQDPGLSRPPAGGHSREKQRCDVDMS